MVPDPAVPDDGGSDDAGAADTDTADGAPSVERPDREHAESAGDPSESTGGSPVDPVEARLDDALERVAHGATVSVPSILVQRGLTVAFTAVLTNGFAAGSYGVFAVARRLQQFLLHVALGFRSGLSRFLPNAESAAERDALVTVAGVLLGSVATLFGIALFLGAPAITAVADQRPLFTAILRVFALGLPATVWLFTTTEILRGLEEVVPLNLALRIGFPAAQLAVGVVGTVVYGDLVAVAVGVVAVSGLVGLGATAWLVRERGLGLRVRGVLDSATESGDAGTAEGDGAGSADGSAEGFDLREVWRRYVGYTIPLFVGGSRRPSSDSDSTRSSRST